ncbi:MAG: efflux RND transporter periplasmic adaptor subunit [Gemmobacter sp.]
MIKRLVIAILAVGAIGVAIVGFNLFRDQAIEDFFATRVIPPAPVVSEVARTGSWTPAIEAIGTVLAARGIDLAVEGTGVVRAVMFAPNEVVAEGALLVRIDDSIERADLEAAWANVRVAEQALDRIQTLGARGITPAASVEETQAAAESARAQIERLNAILNQKALHAPFGGTIGIPRIEAGQFVTPGTLVATLQDLDTLEVDFSVPEQARPQLAIGQRVVLAGEDGRELAEGRISGIEPRIDPRTRLVHVRARIETHDGSLSPGQFVRLRVVLPGEEGAIVLPQTSLVSSLYGDYAFVVRENPEGEGLIAVQVFVTAGRRAGPMVEIVAGIEPGDRVVTVGQNRLRNGMPVTPSGADAAAPGAGTSETGAAAGDAQ